MMFVYLTFAIVDILVMGVGLVAMLACILFTVVCATISTFEVYNCAVAGCLCIGGLYWVITRLSHLSFAVIIAIACTIMCAPQAVQYAAISHPYYAAVGCCGVFLLFDKIHTRLCPFVDELYKAI
jgi:hypothetical protein